MNISAVIVTYNRKESLIKTLQYFDELTSPPESIIIVNNNSTDGTDDVIKAWNKKTKYTNVHHINLSENIGGSGGFYEGIKYALNLNAEWIWLSDDDAFPDKNCFSLIRDKIKKIKTDNYSAICCSVINNGYIDKAHRRRILNHKVIFKKERSVPLIEYDKPEFELDLFSYVGTVINAGKIKKAGLTDKDYFIWNDDTEHSWRLSKIGKIICIPKAKIYHDTPSLTKEITWKTFYGERNKLFMYKKHAYLTYLKMLFQLRKRISKSNISHEKKLLKSVLYSVQKNKKGTDEIYNPRWRP
ncbi:glycosyltransferase [Pectobacterium parmentieri]|uniref:glycosyltransferase n=1 Tax=Pectobacterium parmentieri TaxID=1905730 RepID=UPI0018DF1DFE|nr:glycosyltransferase [Pectobacterium parmentieri]MBI0549613.1 glycosyltransferase [Pectobacterium parmentieri]MBI0558630.1 glycosyltransferase [Pectobacterium parmentieri]MBI0562716.1 glycosyltransferase [Pectobacterium parmentieri]